jgi:hypothetical protein
VWSRPLSMPAKEALKPFYALGLNIGARVSRSRRFSVF